MPEVDQRLVRLVRQVDEERQLRLKAEKANVMLKAAIVRLTKLRTADGTKPKARSEQL